MKVCFTMKPQKAAFGGGNQFALNFVDFLEKKKVKVVYDLGESNIDIIFIMDPRILKYNHIDLSQIKKYKQKYPKTKIIHRVNDCDKPRGDTNNLDSILIETFKISDLIIFVSQWTKNYFINEKNCKFVENKSTVINNGCNFNYFYPPTKKNLKGKIKIITHHWSSNSNKGKDIYEQLNQWVKDKNYEFIYIGRESNVDHKIGPFFGLELANQLRKAHIYVTASQFENCPMHVIEALACGLPLCYSNNIGGGVEIANKHGSESFDNFEELTQKIEKITNNYNNYPMNYKLLNSDLSNEKYYDELLYIFDNNHKKLFVNDVS